MNKCYTLLIVHYIKNGLEGTEFNMDAVYSSPNGSTIAVTDTTDQKRYEIEIKACEANMEEIEDDGERVDGRERNQFI